jgi:hypothetical protein
MGKEHLIDLVVDEGIILKLIIYIMSWETGFTGSFSDPVEIFVRTVYLWIQYHETLN